MKLISAFRKILKMKYIIYHVQKNGKNIEKKNYKNTKICKCTCAGYICILMSPGIFITELIICTRSSDKLQTFRKKKKKKGKHLKILRINHRALSSFFVIWNDRKYSNLLFKLLLEGKIKVCLDLLMRCLVVRESSCAEILRDRVYKVYVTISKY